MPSYTPSTHIVFLDLPKELQDALDEIREIYNPEAVKRGKPHITLKQDEDFSISSEKITHLVEVFLKESLPISVKTLGAKILQTGAEKFMVYVGVESSLLVQKVKQLSKILEKHLSFMAEDAGVSTKWEQSDDFFLHITIALNLPNQKEAEIVAEKVNTTLKSFSNEVVCSLVSVCNWSGEKWNCLKTIH